MHKLDRVRLRSHAHAFLDDFSEHGWTGRTFIAQIALVAGAVTLGGLLLVVDGALAGYALVGGVFGALTLFIALLFWQGARMAASHSPAGLFFGLGIAFQLLCGGLMMFSRSADVWARIGGLAVMAWAAQVIVYFIARYRASSGRTGAA